MFAKYSGFLSVWLVLLLLGCAHNRGASVPGNSGSAGAPGSYTASDGAPGSSASTINIVEPNGVVTLRNAVRYALVKSPELRAFSFELRAAEARTQQAGLLPNPEITVEIEEFGGTGPRTGLGAAETSIQLGQLIELGDKRAKRMQLATVERDLRRWDYESRRLDVMHAVTHAFIDVLASQEQLTLAQEMVTLAEATYAAVEQRVVAGKDSPVEQTKAQVTLATAKLTLSRAQQALTAARIYLALAWGSEVAGFDKVAGDFYRVSPVPPFHELARLLSGNPDLARWDTETRRRRAALDLQRATGIPSMAVKGGLQYFNESDDTAVILGLAIPLPVFDRNQGGIKAASEMLAKTRDDTQAAQISVRLALARAIEGLSTAFTEVTVLTDEVLPAAQRAYEAADEGYRQGKFDYLSVLDAQRTLFEARAQRVSSLTAYHRTRAAIERLIVRKLDWPDETANDNEMGGT